MQNALKKPFLRIIIIQIVLILEKHVFDFLGYMWLLIVINFIQIIFLIFGFYGVKNDEERYVLLYKAWTLIWIIWNILLCCIYTEIGSFEGSYHYLNFNVYDKFANGQSWWSYNRILCIQTSKMLFNKTGQAKLLKSHSRHDCLFNGHVIDLLHTCLQLLFAIIALLLSFYYSVLKENKNDVCKRTGSKQNAFLSCNNRSKCINTFKSTSQSTSTTISHLNETASNYQHNLLKLNGKQNKEVTLTEDLWNNQTLTLGKRKSPFYNIFNPHQCQTNDPEDTYGLGECKSTNLRFDHNRRQPITNLDDTLEPWLTKGYEHSNHFPPPPPESLSTLTTTYPCYNSDNDKPNSRYSNFTPSPIVSSPQHFGSAKLDKKTINLTSTKVRKGANLPEKMNSQLSAARKRRTNRGSTRRNRLKNRTTLAQGFNQASYCPFTTVAYIPSNFALSKEIVSKVERSKIIPLGNGYVLMDDQTLPKTGINKLTEQQRNLPFFNEIRLGVEKNSNFIVPTHNVRSKEREDQFVSRLLRDDRRKNIMQLQDINFLKT